MEIIGPKLKERYGFTLTEIRELINELAGGNIIRNNKVKLRLQRYYENEISFSSSNSKNESLMVFSLKLDINEIIERMRKVDNIKTAAKEIREALQKVDFGLTNKFFDSDELNTSWMTTEMPDEMLTFLSTLLNINKGFLLSNSVNEEAYSDPDQSKMDTKDDDDEYDIENIATCHDKKMSVSAKVIFQILYYSIHSGLKQTPLHLMVGHTIYDKCKSRELITCMDRALISVSYNEVLRKRQQLAAYVIHASGNGNNAKPFSY
ncbi:hypothetical protein JTE90_001722 [Oedothorax gibbosus]|uniref:Uncharacterized protein n=1 Tax=Oedothorax gibbosus TaxID=931172 RepID=A0AAV6U1L0_9ARAC|nr:hypothetical protein JTE90_001722 [Oedothorax gibbosus]